MRTQFRGGSGGGGALRGAGAPRQGRYQGNKTFPTFFFIIHPILCEGNANHTLRKFTLKDIIISRKSIFFSLGIS